MCIRDSPNTHTTLHFLTQPTTLKQLLSSPALYYKQILNNIPPSPNNTTYTKQIHTSLKENRLRHRSPNNILNKHTPEIAPEFNSLPRISQSSLAKLRCIHHPKLQYYKHRFNLNQTTTNISQNCNQVPEDTSHFFLFCLTNSQHRTTWNITSLEETGGRRGT